MFGPDMSRWADFHYEKGKKMSEERIEYDAGNNLMRVFRSFSKAKTLVPKDELQKWTKVLKAGKDDQGRDVEAVRYVFSDRETAEYNHQALAFAGLQTFVKTDGGEESVGDDPGFSVREDFGIED